MIRVLTCSRDEKQSSPYLGHVLSSEPKAKVLTAASSSPTQQDRGDVRENASSKRQKGANYSV